MTNKPYWLVRTPGKTAGVGTATLDDAITSDKAIEVVRERYKEFGDLGDLEAVLVTLSYEDGQPIVEEVK